MTYPNIQQALRRGFVLPLDVLPAKVCTSCGVLRHAMAFKASRHKCRIRSRSEVCKFCEMAQRKCDRIGGVVDCVAAETISIKIRRLKEHEQK